jgi:acetoacetyl-CoA synthetase
MSIASFDETGVHRDDLPGELVCTRPFVSMPLGFYNDPRREAYRSAYFAHYPGVWRHGDMITMKHDTGGIVIHGRSDTTLNPGGVRIGTAELYRCVESLDDVLDSIAAPFRLNGDEHVVLFIKVRSHALVQTKTIPAIIQACRSELTPRHVPWRIFAVDDVPYTKSGKKVEVAVAAIINGSLSRGEVANPECLEQYRMIASQHLNAERTS